MPYPVRSIAVAALLVLSGPVLAEERAFPCAHYGGAVSIEARKGNERSLGETSLFLPIACSQDRLLYSDIRYKQDNNDNYEGNVALGLRDLQDSGILGVYAYLDRKRSGLTEKLHTQVTAGGEWLAEDWEVRANAYLPVTREKRLPVGLAPGTLISNPYLAGSGIFVDQAGLTAISEVPLYGGDLEGGFKIPATGIWLHGAAYRFDGNGGDAMNGARVRASWQVHDNLTLLAEGQDDNIRERQGWVGARVTVPFGGPARKPEGLRTRMTASPVRDVDIVTSGVVGAVRAGGPVSVLNTETGQEQRLVYVDNTASGGGDGSYERPFNTLAAAQAVLQDNDILHIASGDGSSTGMDSGLSITQSGVQVIGSGSSLVYESNRFRPSVGPAPTGSTVLYAAGLAPVISNTAGNGITITGANPYLTGLTVDGATGHGLHVLANSGANLGDITVENFAATNNTLNGIKLAADGAGSAWDEIAVRDVVFDSNGEYGLSVDARNSAAVAAVDIGDVNGTNATWAAVVVETDTNATVGDVNIHDVDVNGGTSDTVGFYIYGGSRVGDVNVNNVTAMNVEWGALYAWTDANSFIDNLDASNIVSDGSRYNGVGIYANGEISDVSLSDITTINGLRDGVTFNSYKYNGVIGSIGNVSITNLTSTNNARYGLWTIIQDDGELGSLSLSNVDTSDNGNSGMRIVAQTGGDIGALTISNAVSSSNTGRGLDLVSSGAGSSITSTTLEDITTTGNTGRGVSLAAGTSGQMGTLTVENVASTQNSQNGISVEAVGGGQIASAEMRQIIASDNLARGMTFYVSDAGSTIGTATLEDVTASNNTQHGMTLEVRNNSLINLFDVRNAAINDNNQGGLVVSVTLGGQVGNAAFQQVVANDNTWDGISVTASGAGSVVSAATIEDSETRGNGSKGIMVQSRTGAQVGSAELRSLLSTGNTLQGAHVFADGTSTLSALLEGVTATGNTSNGIFIDDDTTGAFTADLGGGALGSTGNNSIFGNTAPDIRVDLDGGQLKAENNWWGINTGLAVGERTLDAGSTIDSAPHLLSAP